MRPKEILSALENLVKTLDVDLRYENLGDDEQDIGSGLCRLRGRRTLLIDRRLDTAARIDVLCRELSRMDLERIYIKPYLRGLINRNRPAAGSGSDQ
jgi:hypothetical protein